MTPVEFLSAKGMLTDPEQIDAILKKEFAELIEHFDPQEINVIWESYPRNIHPHWIAAWFQSNGWMASVREEVRDKKTVVFPVIFLCHTMMHNAPESFKVNK